MKNAVFKKNCEALLLIFCFHITAWSQEIKGTYAIQNIETKKVLRPYQADRQDGNKVILYPHFRWKCLTWNFTSSSENSYTLKNVYTGKNLEPSSLPEDGVGLWQQPLNSDGEQVWEFIKTSKGYYNIKLKGTELYVTISSGDTNSDIILLPKDNSKRQLWRLIAQNPLI